MTLRTALTLALTTAGLAGLTAPAAAQVYIDPVNGSVTIGGNFANPVVGSTSYYYTPGTGMTYGSTGHVVPGTYSYTTPTTGWYPSAYTYPNTGYTTYSYPWSGATYPNTIGSSYYYPSYSSGLYSYPGSVNAVTSYPYNTYSTARRWFRR